VLVLLAGTTHPLSGREVERLSGGAHNTVRLALKRLSEQGLVDVQEAGRGAALLYSLNREHLAADAVEILAALRERLFERLRDALNAWELAPAHAYVFGSAARGDGNTGSDVDLFIVRPAGIGEEDQRWRAQLARLAKGVRRWTGNHAGIAEVSEHEVQRLVREQPRIIADLRQDAITLMGDPIHALLGAPDA